MVGGGVCGIWRPGEGGLGEGERRASRVGSGAAACRRFLPRRRPPNPSHKHSRDPALPPIPRPRRPVPAAPPPPRHQVRTAIQAFEWVGCKGRGRPGSAAPGGRPPHPPRAGPRFGKQKQRWRVRGCLPPACWAGQGPGGRPRAALQTATGRPAHPPTRLQGGLVERAGGPRARAAGGAPRVPMPRQRRGAGAPSARPHQGLARAGTPTRR